MLTVYIDFKSPASYLAIKPTLALSERYGIDVIWRPFATAEREPPKLSGNETIGESHRRVRAQSRRAIHTKYAAMQGISLRFPDTVFETDLALGALAIIESRQLDFIKTAFAAYWEDHSNLNDPEVVMALLVQSGVEIDGLDPEQLFAAQKLAQSTAEDDGIVEAPAYLIEDQLFIGREHLPWIEEIVRAQVPAFDTTEKESR